MGRYLMKPDSREDFYVEYSTVVDAPVAWGSRADFQGLEDSAVSFGDSSDYGDERFQRADATGSSSFIGEGAFDEMFLMIREGFKRSELPAGVAYCEVPRIELRAFLESSGDSEHFNASYPSLRHYAYGDDDVYELFGK